FYTNTNVDNFLLEEGIDFSKKDINDINWLDEWKKYLKPDLLTDNFAYINSKDIIFENINTIYIKPALAFGTGSHPTTRNAATLLEGVCKDRVVLDVGCGSCILSILAEKSGAKKVIACDIDKLCVLNIIDNLKDNNCNKIYAYIGSIDFNYDKIKCDVIVANIIYEVIANLWEYFLYISPKFIILSGFLGNDLNNFLSNYDLKDYKIDCLTFNSSWWGIRLCK
ncbi:MAG: 50S ribosomal protein L11 methyltransferase, partial [Deferribacterota bacterium]|nr:50S ribosomal protein L11 methyltransferase [Deferribacterota bacterium]